MYDIYFVTEIICLVLAKPADSVYAVGRIVLFTSSYTAVARAIVIYIVPSRLPVWDRYRCR
jgi:hypothetical protein